MDACTPPCRTNRLSTRVLVSEIKAAHGHEWERAKRNERNVGGHGAPFLVDGRLAASLQD